MKHAGKGLWNKTLLEELSKILLNHQQIGRGYGTRECLKGYVEYC